MRQVAKLLHHFDGVLANGRVVRFDIGTIKAFTHIVNTVILAVIEHHHLAATLVIDAGAFQKGATHGIFDIVAHETVTIVTQVKRLVLIVHALASFKQRIVDAAGLIFFVHFDGYGFFVIQSAIATHQRNASIHIKSFCAAHFTAIREILHMHGVFNFFVQFWSTTWAACIRLDIDLFKETRVHGQCNHRHLYFLFIDKVSIRHHFFGEETILIGGTTKNRILFNLDFRIKFRRILGRGRTILRTMDGHAIIRRGRIQFHRFAIETSRFSLKIKLGSHSIVCRRFVIRLFGSRLFKILPRPTIDNAPAHARSKFRIIHRITDSIIPIDQINRPAILVEFPVGVSTLMPYTITYGAVNNSNIALIAENSDE